MRRFRACRSLRGKRVDGRSLPIPVPPRERLPGNIIFSVNCVPASDLSKLPRSEGSYTYTLEPNPELATKIVRLWADGKQIEIPVKPKPMPVPTVDS